MERIKRPRPNPKSERVVIDEVFSDGTARVLRASRKKDRNDPGLDIEAWENEKEKEVKILHLEFLLAHEREGRHLKEGDVFFLVDGEEFFEKRLKHVQELLKKYDKLDLEQVQREEKTILQEFPDIAKILKPEHLIETTEASRVLVRREIKKEYQKLTVTQGIKDKKIRDQLYEAVEKAVESEEEMEKFNRNE
jgi:hypothetical protein